MNARTSCLGIRRAGHARRPAKRHGFVRGSNVVQFRLREERRHAG
jgi:hypothetical protein